MDMDYHALAVDIGNLHPRGFGSPQAGGVQKHQNHSVAKVGCGRDQLLDLFRARTTGSFFGTLVSCMSYSSGLCRLGTFLKKKWRAVIRFSTFPVVSFYLAACAIGTREVLRRQLV